MNHFLNFIRGSEKKRSMNAEDGHVRRNFLVLQDVHLPFAQIFVRDLGNCSRGCDFANVNKSGKDHSRFDRHR